MMLGILVLRIASVLITVIVSGFAPALAQTACDAACQARLTRADAEVRRTPSARNYLRHADAQLGAGNHRAAIVDYTAAIALQSDMRAAYRRRALAHRALYDWPAALRDYEKALSLDSINVDAHVGHGLANVGAGRLVDAVADFTRAIRLDDEDPLPLYHRAQAWREIGVYADALADYDAAIQRDSDNAMFLNGRSQAYRLVGALEKALSDADAAIKADPLFAAAYHNRGLIRYAQGQVPAAIDDLSMAIHFAPAEPNSYAARGYALTTTGAASRAVADYDIALRLSPLSADNNALKAEALIALSDLAKARVHIDRALLLDANHKLAHLLNIRLYQISGDELAADRSRDLAVHAEKMRAEARGGQKARTMRALLAPSLARALNEGAEPKGIAIRAAGPCEHDKGLLAVRACAQIHHLRSGRLDGPVGWALLRNDDADGALEYLDRALRQPNAVPAFTYFRAVALLERGDVDGSLAALTTIQKLVSTEISSLFTRAAIYRLRGEHRGALRDYAKVLEFRKEEPNYLRLMGWTAYSAGDDKLAIRYLSRSLKGKPDPQTFIYLHIARTRAGQKSDLSAELARYNPDRWLFTVGEHLAGRISSINLYRGALSEAERCEAHFYAGVRLAIEKKVKDAREALSRVLQSCPRARHEIYAAAATQRARLPK
ncbi:MAG: tetratricopeptide repeat protein [Hyphomicrobiaceae bacterium]